MCKTKVDDFIGTTFPTPKGGVLTVTGWEGERSGSAKVYTVVCSICSKDKELFPEGFKSNKGHLKKRHYPCGCAKSPRWSESQYKIRVQRECAKRGYRFYGWFGRFKGSRKTKLDLENTTTGNRWTSAVINTFLRGVGDPEEGLLKIKEFSTIDDIVHIEAFRKAGFTEKYKFTRNTERVNNKGYCTYWNYTCPICSNDDYVQVGLCSGVFTSYVSCLKKGKKSCRCSVGYRWTQEQREYQIKKVCAEEGLTFSGWDNEKEDYKNSFSKFKWICSKGHECTTEVNSFLQGTRCMTCRIEKQKEQGNGYGYYPHRTEESDTLYILDFGGKYIKIGRSFDIARRIVELRKESGIQNITTLYTVNGTHQEVYDLEQALHEHLEDRGFSYTTDWGSVECFDSDSLSLVYNLIDEDINDSSNTLEEGEW